jgi:hypothetical protein
MFKCEINREYKNENNWDSLENILGKRVPKNHIALAV